MLKSFLTKFAPVRPSVVHPANLAVAKEEWIPILDGMPVAVSTPIGPHDAPDLPLPAAKARRLNDL